MTENIRYNQEETSNYVAIGHETQIQPETTSPLSERFEAIGSTHFAKNKLQGLLNFFRRQPKLVEMQTAQPDDNNVATVDIEESITMEQLDTNNNIETTQRQPTEQEVAAEQATDWLNKYYTDGVDGLDGITSIQAQEIYRLLMRDYHYEDLREDWSQVIYALRNREKQQADAEAAMIEDSEQIAPTSAANQVEDVVGRINDIDSYRWGVDRLAQLAEKLMMGKPGEISNADYAAQLDNVIDQMNQLQQIMTFDGTQNINSYGESPMEIKLNHLDPLEATLNQYRARWQAEIAD